MFRGCGRYEKEALNQVREAGDSYLVFVAFGTGNENGNITNRYYEIAKVSPLDDFENSGKAAGRLVIVNNEMLRANILDH